jgi:hypothetical protein
MNVKITFPESEMEFDVPEKKLELVKALLFELAAGAKNTPK